MEREAIALVLFAGLILACSPVFAFPEITSHRIDETDALPPTYIAEQQAVNDSHIWSRESIFHHFPEFDSASTPQGLGPVLRDHSGAARNRRQSVRQRIRDMANMFFPDKDRLLPVRSVSNNTASPAQRGRSRVETGSTASELLIESSFSEFILDIVEPNVEPEGVIAMTIRGLGQFALMNSRSADSIVLVDIEKMDSFRMSEGRNLISGARSNSGMPAQLNGPEIADNFGSTNSLRTFLRNLPRLAIATLTHPGFIAFVLMGIGVMVLRRLIRHDR